MKLLAPLPRKQKLRTVIIGAGIAGRLVLEELRRHKRLGYVPVGFLDDDPRKQRRKIGGLPVFGPISKLSSIAQNENLKLVIFAIPSADGLLHRRVTQLVRASNLEMRVVPGVYELLSRDTQAGQVRPVSVEDFFRRPPVAFDLNSMRQALTGKIVLITGAAGSIGQELSKQLAVFEPSELILFDHEESNLYETSLALKQEHPALSFRLVIGDIRDRLRVGTIFKTYRPEVIYHAAAYKHVPLMEHNVIEAIKTNAIGTSVLVEAAAKIQSERFVLISTDKAVNPSSVMGACKRFSEKLVQSAAKRFPSTAFMIVRFGNVVASRGNVIERFSQQIAKGGPVTVTDFRMRRYFMTREEAAQLVMQASAMGRGGEIFILDMGRQVPIVDIAREMIRLSGLKPGSDIKIIQTGIRPGEKLDEELMTPKERTQSTLHKRIRVIANRPLPWLAVSVALRSLQQAIAKEDPVQGRHILGRYVENYQRMIHERKNSPSGRKSG